MRKLLKPVFAEMEKNRADVFPRTFRIALSDKQTEALFVKAESAGISPEMLLADFIGCLTSATADDDDLAVEKANDWLKCCRWYSDGEVYSSFLQYVLKRGIYGEVIDLINDIEDCSAFLGFMGEPVLEQKSEFGYEETCEKVEILHKRLDRIFADYCKKNGGHKTYAEEIQIINEYDVRLNSIMLPTLPQKDESCIFKILGER